jgi:lipoic acid synthetase
MELNDSDRARAGFRALPVLEARPPARPRHPSWIKVRFAESERYRFIKEQLRARSLHTVCEEAECPNIGECWGHGTATFLLLGDVCTRGCKFCAIGKGKPEPLDPGEPEKVAEVIAALRLDYAVLTSVDRDDLPDEGADAFARTIEAIHRRLPACRIEALVPDFHARGECIQRVALAPLFVFAHNVETVPRLYPRVRPGSDYERSLSVLLQAKELAAASGRNLLTKSSLMLGLGETDAELLEVFTDLRRRGCDILTLGQYLRPSPEQLEVFRYVAPETFAELRRKALALGFRQVVAGPLVRSSYHAWETAGRGSECQVPGLQGAGR